MRYLRPLVDKSLALEKLSKKRLFRRPDRLKRAELVYLPYFLHTFEISRLNQLSRLRALCDSVTGVVVVPDDAFESHFDAHDGVHGQPLELQPQLDAGTAQQLARDEIARLVLREAVKLPHGRELDIHQATISEVALPYWVAYVERGESYSIRAIDALTGTKVGFRLKSALLAGLTATAGRPVGAKRTAASHR